MKNFFTNNIKYIKLILAIIVSYIFIKAIDNFPDVLTVLKRGLSILAPFIIAFIIAYVLNPIVNLFNKKAKLSRSLSITLTYLLFISIVALVITFLLPKLYTNLAEFINNIPAITANVQNFVNKLVSELQAPFNFGQSSILPSTDATSVISAISSLMVGISNLLLSSIFSITSSLINFILGFLISVYVLVDKDRFISFGKRITYIILGNKNGSRFLEFIKTLNYMIGSYIGIKAIDSSIIASIAFVGLTLIGSEYTLLLTVIVGLTNMIPYFGPFVGMIAGCFINLFFSPLKALVVFLFLFCLQQFDGWYLDPRLVGNRLGLRPFMVILGVTVGGALYGPIGMLLGSPVMAVIRIYTVKIMDKFSYRMKSDTEINNSF